MALSYTITDRHTKKLKELTDTAAEKLAFLSTQSEACKEAMKTYALVSTIGSSTRIENATLTDTEISWMDEKLSADNKPTAFVKEKSYIGRISGDTILISANLFGN